MIKVSIQLSPETRSLLYIYFFYINIEMKIPDLIEKLQFYHKINPHLDVACFERDFMDQDEKVVSTLMDDELIPCIVEDSIQAVRTHKKKWVLSNVTDATHLVLGR